MCSLSVNNVIYHKFSHGATFYTLNGENVNVMLEYAFFCFILYFLAVDGSYFDTGSSMIKTASTVDVKSSHFI